MKFILSDGYVKSKNDGDIHHISREQLSKLYKIPLNQTIESTVGVNWNWIRLHPREDGQYDVARCVHEQIENQWIPLAEDRLYEKLNKLSLWNRLKFLFKGRLSKDDLNKISI